MLTNKQGEVVSRRDFMPFGEEIAAMAETHRTPGDKYGVGDSVRQKFTGYERDEETGLDFAEARYYYNNHGRFTAVDPLLASGKSADPQTFNRYAYTMNRPLILTDPTGKISTHTDRNGVVLHVIDDGDLNVYRHMDLVAGQEVPDTSQCGDDCVQIVGQTEYWDEFREQDNESGEVLENVAPGAKINFGGSWETTILLKEREARQLNLIERAEELKPGGNFDIKNEAQGGPHVGALLEGKYATARSAGNYLAGKLGATGTLGSAWLSENSMLRLSGALHRGKLTDRNAIRIVLFGAEFGREIPYAERRIRQGFRAGVRSLDSRNIVNRPRVL